MASMIKRSITSPCFEAIKKYLERHKDEELANDKLEEEDWAILKEIHEFLDTLLQITLALEAHHSTLDTVLPIMDFVLEQFENFKERHRNHPILAPIFNSGWNKMEKYYRLTNDTPAYVAAIVLNPNFKWQYIQANWNEVWIQNAKPMMEDF